jgi:NACHT domain-containing protein
LRTPEERTRRLRVAVVSLLAVAALISAAATLTERLHLQLGLSLTVALTVLAVIAPLAESWLKQAQALLDKQDQKEEERARQLSDRARRDVLEQVRRAWVQPELSGSLYEQARIELGLAERPTAVDNPLRAVVRRSDGSDHALEPGQPAARVYRQLGNQMLILGEPGVGKTTLLMELVDQLLGESEAVTDQPLPVVFHLSTWAIERRPLATWLVDELYKRYGVSRRLGRLWIDTEQVIPMLDGLDEVQAEHRDSCAAAINAFHDDHGQLPLVICSRVTEYEALQAKLRLRGAIVIQPLSRLEVGRYLRQAGRRLAGLRAVLRDDDQLAGLLTTPLFLSIVALTYRDRQAAAVRGTGTFEERRRRVLADYVAAMLERPGPSGLERQYSVHQTVHWLSWLARAMQAHGQSIFYLDWMQPDWLPRRSQQRIVTIGSAVAAAVVGGLFITLVFELILAKVFGVAALVDGLAVGLGAGLAFGLGFWRAAHEPTIAPIEQMRWSRSALRRSLLGQRGLGLLVGLVAALLAWAAFGLAFGLGVALVFALIGGLETRGYAAPLAPGMAIQKSKRNALVSGLAVGPGIGLAVGLLSGLVFWVIDGPADGLIVGLLTWVVFGLGAALMVGLRRGGEAYLRHQVLRQLLVRNRSIPRDYVAFLEYASRLILLRRRGGAYEFVHRLLLEYFAALELQGGAEDRSEPLRETISGKEVPG